MNKSWIRKHFLLAVTVASYSKDSSTQCGAIIVRPDNSVCSTGYNGFPRGVKDTITSRNKRPNKYLYTEHAERNAIYNSHDDSMEGYSLLIQNSYSSVLIVPDQ
jgi:dCMP deaminase